MAGFSYLLNRRGHYYFRIAIPHALAPRFNARELIYSLKTKNLGEAKLRCRSMHQAALWFFRGIEGMPRITPEEAKKIAQSYFKECLDRLAVQVVTVDLYSDSLMKVLNQRPDIPAVAGVGVTDDLRRLDFLLPDNFDYKNKDDPAEVTGMTLGFRNAFDGDTGRIVDYLRGKHEIDVEKGSLSYKTLEKAVGRAIGELLRIHQAKTNLEADIPVVDEWFKDSSPKVAAIAPPEDETPLVSAAKNLFLEESRKAEEAERTLRRKDTAISFWIEVMGDVPMGSITKKGARTYKETLAKLPANMKKRYPDKTVKEVVALSIPASQLMKPQTINDYLGKMQSFIKWAQNNGYYPDTSNHFAGMSLKDRTKKKKKRESFSDDQLKALFSTPVHTGCKGAKQTQRYQSGEVLVKDAIYWLPLIALHTGARMGEICQLYVSDLKKIGSIWVFDFNDEGDDKSLKTEASRRKVPFTRTL